MTVFLLQDLFLDQVRTALVTEEGMLLSYYETAEDAPGQEALFAGKITGKAGNGRFYVDIGQEKSALLEKTPKGIGVGTRLIVQLLKPARAEKGARVTAFPRLSSPYAVLLPTEEGVSFSRRIESEKTRASLTEIASEALDVGAVKWRTEAKYADDGPLIADLETLVTRWEAAMEAFEKGQTGCLWQGISPADFLYRLYESDMGCLHTNAPLSFNAETVPVEKYTAGTDLFALLDIEPPPVLPIKHRLPCGGMVHLEKTEAFYAVDVDSKKASEDVANREAADAIALMLQQKSVSGQIVIDFAGRFPSRKKACVRLEKACQDDPCGCRVAGTTRLGLVEMTRSDFFVPPATFPQLYDALRSVYSYSSAKKAPFVTLSLGRRLYHILSESPLLGRFQSTFSLEISLKEDHSADDFYFSAFKGSS